MVSHLASGASDSGASGWSWIPLSVIFVGVLVLGPIVVRRLRTVRGPVVAGTAEVLSLKQFASVAVNGPARIVCRLRLGVTLPHRDPYTIAIWRNIAPWELAAYHKGRTIAVEVSETNPRKIRLGRSWPGRTY